MTRVFALDCILGGEKVRIGNSTPGYDSYTEYIRMRKMSWKDAYWCCRYDIEYIDKYEDRFLSRHKSYGICRFLVLVLLTILVVMVVALLIWGRGLSFDQIMWVIIISLALIVVEGILRVIYYRKMASKLFSASSRIDMLINIWPEIADIVCSDIENDVFFTPSEPRKNLGMEAVVEHGYGENESMDEFLDDFFSSLPQPAETSAEEQAPESDDWSLILGEIMEKLDNLNNHFQKGL